MAQVLFDEATRVYAGADLPALDDLDLDAADGEFLVLEEPPAAENPPHCECSPAWRTDAGHIKIGERAGNHVAAKASSPPAAARWNYSPRNYAPALRFIGRVDPPIAHGLTLNDDPRARNGLRWRRTQASQ